MPRISELSSLTVPSDDDLLAIVDNSGAITAKITRDDFLTGSDLPDDTVSTDAIQDDSVTADKIDFSSGIWGEVLSRTSLSSSADEIILTIPTPKKYMKLYFTAVNSGALDLGMQFNATGGTGYAFRRSINGAADTSAASAAFIAIDSGSYPVYGEIDILNVATREKMILGRVTGQNSAGGGNIPSRIEVAGKWANTSSQINTIRIYNVGAGDLASGTEMVVVGHD